jgi:acyl-CoA thioester hydrolase
VKAHELQVRVYYEDTDFSGRVYHASYLRFIERGRTELLRELGLNQSVLSADAGGPPVFFVVRAIDVDFKRPATMDDMLCVETVVEEVGGATFSLVQRIRRRDELLVVAKVLVACVENDRARRLPADVREKFTRLICGASVSRIASSPNINPRGA